ncbi:DUF4376 domain-containing protein [Pseudomonas sp. SJZ131]|uniref:DUF4376 domain-containing protein n=1 Tax=Pseudomonas sp. SJZ131 TaxID=2572895 RepID=UPI00119AA4D5|nr:DUF4376 domain-containing protein [Pseudomonas sp. SJZ131]TWD49501.1 uncharacterized protein DUF4376 [Pseudomonas sp. SJZ131]
MHYFVDGGKKVFAFDKEKDAPKGLSPIGAAEALALAAGPPAEVDYPALIAAERYKREGVGITVDGFLIDTTRDGQALIAGAAVSAILDPAYSCSWKTGAGFIERNAAQLVTIATAVREHVQACFDRERDLLNSVKIGEFRGDMLALGWPDSPPKTALDPESIAE